MEKPQLLSPRKHQKYVLKIRPSSNALNPNKPNPSQVVSAFGKINPCSEGQTCSKSPSLRRSCRQKKDIVNICSSKAVCAFARNPSAECRVGRKMGLLEEQAMSFLNNEVFMHSSSPHKRVYRICPKSSSGFRNDETGQAKRATFTEASRKNSNLTFEPWESQLDKQELDMWE